LRFISAIMKNLVLIAFTLFFGHGLYGQAKFRKLPGTVNHPSYNNYAPYLSADANAIVFLSDNAEDNALAPFFSTRDNNDWKEPQALPKSIYSRLNFLRGFALSADGKKLFFTTTKSPTVGGFDIQMSELKGNTWADPANLGLPVNSKSHEACPSLSSDGNTLYFMRCEKMTVDKADACKLFRVDKKPNGVWGEPMELPATINTGNSQSPKIMADGTTLLFSSDKIPGGKGGMDVYSTSFKNGTWTTPVAWDFINTDKDDQDVTVSALGRYIVRDMKGPRKNELVEYLIPDNLRPRGMMKLDGKVLDATGKPIPAYISIVDLTNNKRFYSGRPYPDGSFIVYVMEGSKYELAIEGEQDNLIYYSKQLDLATDKIPQVEKISATIKPLTIGDELQLTNVKFKPLTSELDLKASAGDLDRFARVVKGNPNVKFEIQVILSGFQEDTIQSDPDLTELLYDSVKTTINTLDSAGNTVSHDTIYVKQKFNNDRTADQAISVLNYFTAKGINGNNFSVMTKAMPALPENKNLIVKAVAKPKLN
jgi:hypothetical protein